MLPAIFHDKALQTIRSFPKTAQQELGEALLDLQWGASPAMPLSRPMRAVAPGVYELRIRDATGVYRAFYALKYSDSVLVFHAFEKRTQKTPLHEINLGRARLKEMLNEKE